MWKEETSASIDTADNHKHNMVPSGDESSKIHEKSAPDRTTTDNHPISNARKNKDLSMSCSSGKSDEMLNSKGSKPKPETKNVQQESERVQNVVFDSANDTEHSTLDNTVKKYIIVCENSDMKTPTATPSLDEEPRVSKRKKKPPTTKIVDFLW
jgi:hypothetical protein